MRFDGNLRQACMVVLLGMLATNGLYIVLQGLGISSAENASLSRGVRNTGLPTIPDLLRESDVDSWKPMVQAYQEFREGGSPYALILEGRGKFQYPPTALLPVHGLTNSETRGADSVAKGTLFNKRISWASRLAVIGTIAIAIVLMLSLSARLNGGRLATADVVVVSAAFSAVGLCFYPLLHAHQLGQIQVFINLFLAAAILAWINGARVLAGLLVGCCALIKPQYCVIGLWALLAGQWRFAFAMAGAGIAGLVASVAVFGLGPHVEYLLVLRRLSESGEVAWPNQSMNGLLNRLLKNGNPGEFDPYSFPPYNPTVHLLVTVSSLLILVSALATAWRPSRHSWPRLTYGLGAMIAAVTLASPIAWDHHYGIFLVLFAMLLPSLLGRSSYLRILSLAAFLALGCVLMVWEVVAATSPVRVLLGSHLYFGGLAIFFILVHVSLASNQRHHPVPAPTTSRGP